MKKIVSAAALLLASSLATAGTVEGVVGALQAMADGKFLVTITGTASGSPTCVNASQANRFVIDGSTAGGRNQVNVLQTAKTLGLSVKLFGTGACLPLWTDNETLNYLILP